MKQLICLLFTGLFVVNATIASPGDTTWVQAHSTKQLDHYGIFDAPVQFPNGNANYRKIIMTFTLGRYGCPSGTQYCSDWDYTVLNYLMTPGGDTLELGRLITPYSKGARMTSGWTQRYEFDVTDFYPLLKDAATIRLYFSGYSFGFTGDIKFAFIEGNRTRDVLGIKRLWNGSFPYGDPSNPISNYMTPFMHTAPADTKSAEMKFTITGHGADDEGCSEFCKKVYEVKVNGSTTEQKDIWRDDCGSNHVYPQNGTWIYNRGNWCPGDLINPNIHNLPNIGAGASYTVGVDMEQYNGTVTRPNASRGSYTIESGVWYFGDFSRKTDASLEDVIAPSNHEVHFRENPNGGSPIIAVKNNGANAITSIKFEYGIEGQQAQQHTWSGNMPSLQKINIQLPVLYSLQAYTGTGKFVAKITEVNGQADEDNLNNTIASTFQAAPQWNSSIIITMRTNNVAENGWKIIFSDNTVVKQRTGTEANKIYTDTVSLWPGSFRLEATDGGCDGLSWWANTDAGNGSMQAKSIAGGTAYKLAGYYSGDFGCGFTQYFNVNWPQGINDVTAASAAITAYPNPASSTVHVSLEGMKTINGKLNVIDAIGRVVMQQTCNSSNAVLDLARLSNGMYTITYTDANNTSLKTRIVVAK